jgi:prolyl oligopeptidase
VQVPQVRTEQVTYKSKDGTLVRMLVVSAGEPGAGEPGAGGEDGAQSDPAARSPRPTILYGYGGFGVSMNPGYSASILAWVEAGGVYAIAALRGGGEEGEEWHRAGMRERKQNVFDDFHAAAERLIADGWTTSRQLAISGGSNGGLLVGTAITQRPGLYAAAVCSAPLLDMVRYERFGLGETWNDEFGTAADPEQLGWLLGYSPYHHVREGTAYPAVLFSVFDSDTRVDPMHARKMCAALQHASSAALPGESASAGGPGHAARPVLLRRESSAGHGARAVSRSVTVAADTLAFAAFHTGHPGIRR